MQSNRIKVKRVWATTLLEVVLYLALLSAMIIGVGGFVREILTARNKQQAVIEVENEAAVILGTLERDLKLASTVTSPSSGGSGNTLTLTVPGTPGFTRSYSLSSGSIQQITTPGATAILTSNRVTFSNVIFRHISTNPSYHVLTVSFTASYVNPGGRNDLSYQKTYHTSVTLRPNL